MLFNVAILEFNMSVSACILILDHPGYFLDLAVSPVDFFSFEWFKSPGMCNEVGKSNVCHIVQLMTHPIHS